MVRATHRPLPCCPPLCCAAQADPPAAAKEDADLSAPPAEAPEREASPPGFERAAKAEHLSEAQALRQHRLQVRRRTHCSAGGGAPAPVCPGLGGETLAVKLEGCPCPLSFPHPAMPDPHPLFRPPRPQEDEERLQLEHP